VAQAAGPVVVGLDGGYVRSRHRQEAERHFEVVAGKVLTADGAQHASQRGAWIGRLVLGS
jgi:hypothetical protein